LSKPVSAEACATQIARGRAHVISMPYALDGRVSSHPPDQRGWSAYNAYLVREGGRALLIDTGVSAAADGLLTALDGVLPPDTPLAIWGVRTGEYPSAANAGPVAAAHPTFALYSAQTGTAAYWVDFGLSDDLAAAVADLENVKIGTGDTIPVDEAGERLIEIIDPPLRLLKTYWGYDRVGRTLYTSDAFCHVTWPSPDGPWVIGEDTPDPTTAESMRHHLINSRFWWLPGADVGFIRDRIREIFDTHDIQTIAPGWGAVLDGKAVVERHVEILDEVLRTEGEKASAYVPSIGDSARHWARG
jgi:hypothetical protein